MVFLHLEGDVVNGGLKLPRHFFSSLFFLPGSLTTLFLVRGSTFRISRTPILRPPQYTHGNLLAVFLQLTAKILQLALGKIGSCVLVLNDVPMLCYLE